MGPNKCLILCAAANCYSTQHTSTLYKFPKDEQLAREWAKRCGREDFNALIDLYGMVSGNYRLCSAHFTPNQFKLPYNKNKGLLPTALPSIFKKNSLKTLNIKNDHCSHQIEKSSRDAHIPSDDISISSDEHHEYAPATKVIRVKAEMEGGTSAIVENISQDIHVDDQAKIEAAANCVFSSSSDNCPAYNTILINATATSKSSTEGHVNLTKDPLCVADEEMKEASEESWLQSLEYVDDDTSLDYRPGIKISRRARRGRGRPRLGGRSRRGRAVGRPRNVTLNPLPTVDPCSHSLGRILRIPEDEHEDSTLLTSTPTKEESNDTCDDTFECSDDSIKYYQHGGTDKNYVNKRGRPCRNTRLSRRAMKQQSSKENNSARPFRCSYPLCVNSTNPVHDQESLFSFPKQPGRCFVWTKNCFYGHLLDQLGEHGTAHMHNNYKLCYRHFHDETFLVKPNSLIWNAVPTIFKHNFLHYPNTVYRNPDPIKLCSLTNCPYSFPSQNGLLSNTQDIFFSFPGDPVRCALWVTHCNDAAIIAHFNKFGPSYIAQNMFLCKDHFSEHCLDGVTMRLTENALPTIVLELSEDTLNEYSAAAEAVAIMNAANTSDDESVHIPVTTYNTKKNTDLANEIKFLKEELAHLRNDRNRQRAKLRYFRNKIAQTAARASDYYTIDDALRFLKSELSPAAYFFFKVQIFSAKKTRWNDESMDFALHASKCGKNVYNTLSRMFRLPCNATIRRFEGVSLRTDASVTSSKQHFIKNNKYLLKKLANKRTPVSKVHRRMNSFDSRKNRTVAQILEDFLGKQSVKEEYESSNLQDSNAPESSQFDLGGNTEAEISASGVGIINDDDMSSTVDNIVVVPGDISPCREELGLSIVAHNTIVSSNTLTVDDMVAASGSTEPMCAATTIDPQHTSYINVKAMQMEDGTISYIYDI